MKYPRLGQLSFIGASLLIFAASIVRAQTVADNFNTGDDASWTHFNPPGNAVYSFPDGNTYSIQAPMPSAPDAGPARAGAYFTGATFSDFKITVDLVDWDDSSLTHQAIGIIARGQQFGLGTTDGYFFHYDPYGSSGGARLWIDLITNEAPGRAAASVAVAPRLNVAQDYRLEFSGWAAS